MNEKDITGLIERDGWMIYVLRLVRVLYLPDCWIGAGFVRAKVWDTLHDFTERSALGDIDVIYFDPLDRDEATEKLLEKKLMIVDPSIPWSVKNQARMHIPAHEPPYTSTAHAVSLWPETPTCVAVRLNDRDEVELMAPHGIEDLVSLTVNPTPHWRKKPEAYEARLTKKNWLVRWPKLTINHLLEV